MRWFVGHPCLTVLSLSVLTMSMLSVSPQIADASSVARPIDVLFTVPSGSMIPALNIGDSIVADEQPRDFLPLRTGEIVVFHGPAADVVCGSPQGILVKRVVGLSGQTIQSKGNSIYVDGKLLAEPWLPSGTQLGRSIPFQKIPTSRDFVMGDNASVSCDSRYWGTITTTSVIGGVILDCPSNSSEPCKSFAE